MAVYSIPNGEKYRDCICFLHLVEYENKMEGCGIMAERWNMFVTITLDAAWLLEFFIVTLAWTIVCHGMKWPKEKIFIWLTQSILLYVFTAAADALMFVWIGWNSKLYSTLARGVICAVYIRNCSYYKPKTNVLIWCSMYAGVCALSVIAGQMSYLTGAYIGKGAVEGVARCVIYVLMIPLAVYLRRFNFDDYETIPFSGMALIITGDLSILALNVVETVWSGQDNRITIILACAFTVMMLMVIVAIHAMHTICAEQSEIISLQAERQRLLAEQESLKMMESTLEDLRCVRHDLKNQYAYMQILLKENRYEELDQYFRQVAENLPPQLNYIDCGNRSMNTILNMEISKAKAQHIEVTHQLVVPPVLPFPEDDLCAIVANLMDNAIEGCKGFLAESGIKPSIHLGIYPQKSYLLILCRNATNLKHIERRGWGLRTTKGDEKLHGYGTRIVSKTAEKYNGCAEYALEDGCFVAKVMLDMMEGTNHAN